MIKFNNVTREFRGLVDRRNELFTFLGSAYAAMGLFLLNVLQGGLPESLGSIQRNLFACYAFVLLVTSSILGVRMALLHKGMVINGVLYAHFMQGQTFTKDVPSVKSASRTKIWSVSFLQSFQAAIIGAVSAAIFALAASLPIVPAVLIAVAVLAGWSVFYLWQHHRAVAIAEEIRKGELGPVEEEDWREHNAECLQQSSQGLLYEIAFAGLMVFSGFEALSGLGMKPEQFEKVGVDLPAGDVLQHGPVVFCFLMVSSCLLELFVYLRVRVAIGRFSLASDPNDRPYHPWKFTDSSVGFLLMAFLFAVAVHVFATVMSPWLAADFWRVLGVDVLAFAAALGVERYILWSNDRKQLARNPEPPGTTTQADS